MLNMATDLLGSLEQSIMECFWASGAQTSGEILATLRRERTIAHTTVTTTLARLYTQSVLTRVPCRGQGRRQTWRYTARYASRGALLASAFEQLSDHLGACSADRAEALAMLGLPHGA